MQKQGKWQKLKIICTFVCPAIKFTFSQIFHASLNTVSNRDRSLHFKILVLIIYIFLSMVKVLKFRLLFFFCFHIKCRLSGLEFSNCLSEYQTRKTLIRLLLKNQSDLGLHCLSRPIWQTVFKILEHLT